MNDFNFHSRVALRSTYCTLHRKITFGWSSEERREVTAFQYGNLREEDDAMCLEHRAVVIKFLARVDFYGCLVFGIT